MSVETVPREGNLRRVLDEHGVSEARLMAEADNPFGEPLAISVSGSQALGYVTDRQFVQLDVIVEAENITDFAVVSYLDDLRIETIYYGAQDVLRRVGALRSEPWPVSGHIDRGAWLRREQQLNTALRFRLGTALCTTGPWTAHLAALREDWLPDAVSNWWRTEARRRWQAARWLGETTAGAHRYCDAVLYAVECRATALDRLSLAGGHFSIGPCWLADRVDGLVLPTGDDPREMLRTALRAPSRPADAAGYLAWCEEVLGGLLGTVDGNGELAAQLHYSLGVSVRAFGNHTLVSRWEMRALEFDPVVDVPADDTDVVWQGPAGTTPPPAVLDLFRKEMLWLGMLAA